MRKTDMARRLKVAKSTLYRYLVYTGLHDPVGCRQQGWRDYGVFH